MTFSIAALYSASFFQSVVPSFFVPLDIMCSKKCEKPVAPGRSLTEPTFQ
jgi:hypothetical protein